MATAEQLKSLIRSHLSDDGERFLTVALQMAAYEAQQGHGALAHEIRDLVDKARRAKRPNALLKFPAELSGLVQSSEPATPLSALILPGELRERLRRIVREYRQQDRLKSHGLQPRRKVLLAGPPGTGKTMTAAVLAHELRLPLHTIQVDRLVTKFMGETSARLRQIFDLIQEAPGIYLFDEFDAIGGNRALDNDVGEMRRVLNALLQFIEQDQSSSLIIGATNTPHLLDQALFRRFDDVLHYTPPEAADRQALTENLLAGFLPAKPAWKTILDASKGLSHAEVDHACRDALKEAILDEKKSVTADALVKAFKERHRTHAR
jgi:SpoVK/Ycf46/Vps4 family AAA+-type ATPase